MRRRACTDSEDDRSGEKRNKSNQKCEARIRQQTAATERMRAAVRAERHVDGAADLI